MSVSIRICRFIKQCLLFTTGSPYLDCHSELARRVLRQWGLDPTELAEYRQTVEGKGRWSAKLVALWCACLAAKFMLLVVLMLRSADHATPENNVKPLSTTPTNSSQFQFNCLMSNCSQPIGGPKSLGLGHDIKRLPYLWLCHPELVQMNIWSPLDSLDSITLLNNTLLVVWTIIFGSIYPLVMALLAGPNELLMFIVAPQITCALVRDKLAAFHQDLSSSYLNFRSTSIKLRQERHQQARSTGDSPLGLLGMMRAWTPERRHLLGMESALRSSHLATTSAEKLEEYAQDCLPATRTHWYRQQLATLMSSIYVTVMLLVFLVIMAFTVGSVIFENWYKRLMNTFANEMERQNCAIWFAEPQTNSIVDSHSSITIDLRKPVLSYSIYVFIQYFVTTLILALVLSSILSSYYSIIAELQFWISELQIKLIVAIEMLRLHNIMNQAPPASTHFHQLMRRESSVSMMNDLAPTEQQKNLKLKPSFKTALIRDKVIQLASQHRLGFLQFSRVDFSLASIANDEVVPPNQARQTQLEVKIAYQMYALRLLTAHKIGAHTECIEKVYLSFRLFMDLIEQYGRLTAPLLMFAHAITYTLAAMGVYFTRNVRDFTWEPLLIAASIMVVVSIITNFGAVLHSQAMRLVPLIWSLVAQITISHDPKLEHLRLLWLKLSDMIDHENGIYLKALGVRFNYFNIVQLTIGTSTIMILALKD